MKKKKPKNPGEGAARGVQKGNITSLECVAGDAQRRLSRAVLGSGMENEMLESRLGLSAWETAQGVTNSTQK